MKRLLLEAPKDLEIKKVNWRSPGSRLIMEIFPALPYVRAPSSDTSRAVSVISELCSKPGMNFIRYHTFSMEKSDNDPLLGVDVRCQNPERT
jgi:hypothetical protein